MIDEETIWLHLLLKMIVEFNEILQILRLVIELVPYYSEIRTVSPDDLVLSRSAKAHFGCNGACVMNSRCLGSLCKGE